MAAMLTICMLTACSGDDNEAYMSFADTNNAMPTAIYEGEWTVNKQVVDTARMKVSNVLTLRLPEAYLATLCFPNTATGVKPKGIPVELQIPQSPIGYTEKAEFVYLLSDMNSYGDERLYCHASFFATVGDADYRIDLVSSEICNAVISKDTGLWTLCIPINGFLITDMATREERICQLPATVTIYHHSTKRIG
jgi:hypothetical protein